MPILAQLAGYSLLHWIILIMVVAGAVAILYIVLRRLGITIPDWVVSIFWVIVVVIVGVAAVKIIWSML